MFLPIRLLNAAALGLFLAAPLSAATLEGMVVGVADGDTLTVLDKGRRQHKIRLAGIDAPEKRQDFGQRSKESLSELAYRQYVLVDVSKQDRYGRSIGKVLRGSVDVNLEQVRRGLAWHYKEYQEEQSPVDRRAYADAETEARGLRRGLWTLSHPLPPWEYRRNRAGTRLRAATSP